MKEVKKEVEIASFFNFFKDRKAPEDADNSEESDDEMNKLMAELHDDEDLATEIATELIPRAIYYYLGLIQDDDNHSDEESEEEEHLSKRGSIIPKKKK